MQARSAEALTWPIPFIYVNSVKVTPAKSFNEVKRLVSSSITELQGFSLSVKDNSSLFDKDDTSG